MNRFIFSKKFCLVFFFISVSIVIGQLFAVHVNDIKLLSKSELHLHLGGAWPISYLEKIAIPEQFTQLQASLKSVQKGVDYHEAFSVFNVIASIVDTDQKVEDGVIELCQELLANGVKYVQIRTGLKDLGSGLEGYLQAVLRGIQKACVDSHMHIVADVLLSLRRNSGREMVDETMRLLEKYKDERVIGLDISGDSTMGDGDQFLELLKPYAQHDVPIMLHLGESPKETPEQQMKELKILKPKRIGHAVYLCNEAMAWVKENKIPVELCPSSSLMAGMVSSLDQHPAINLIKEGHPVVICTDDPLIFGVTLCDEYKKVADLCGLSLYDLVNFERTVQKIKSSK